jgi:hypothetical protein
MRYKLYGTSREISTPVLGEVLSNKKMIKRDAFMQRIPAKQIYEVTGIDKDQCPIFHNKMIQYFKTKLYGLDCYFIICGGISYFFIRDIDNVKI